MTVAAMYKHDDLDEVSDVLNFKLPTSQNAPANVATLNERDFPHPVAPQATQPVGMQFTPFTAAPISKPAAPSEKKDTLTEYQERMARFGLAADDAPIGSTLNERKMEETKKEEEDPLKKYEVFMQNLKASMNKAPEIQQPQ